MLCFPFKEEREGISIMLMLDYNIFLPPGCESCSIEQVGGLRDALCQGRRKVLQKHKDRGRLASSAGNDTTIGAKLTANHYSNT